MLPILSYAVEIWGVKRSYGEPADLLEVLHESFLKHWLGIRKSTANEIVLADLRRFALQTHLLQQNLRYHHKTMGLDSMRLVPVAMMEGFKFQTNGTVQVNSALCWRKALVTFLAKQQNLFHKCEIVTITDQAKQQHKTSSAHTLSLALLHYPEAFGGNIFLLSTVVQ